MLAVNRRRICWTENTHTRIMYTRMTPRYITVIVKLGYGATIPFITILSTTSCVKTFSYSTYSISTNITVTHVLPPQQLLHIV